MSICTLSKQQIVIFEFNYNSWAQNAYVAELSIVVKSAMLSLSSSVFEL